MNTQTTYPPIRGSLIADLQQLPRPFYLLIAGTFINRFGHFVIPFLAIYLRQLGFTSSVTGYALAAYGIGGLCACFLGGYLADRIGRKPTLLISCYGATAAMLLLSVADTAPTIIGGTFLCGLMTSLFFPASSSLIADLVEQDLRVRAYAVQRFSANLAFALGMTTAGLVASHSFTVLFMADAATTFILSIVILFGLARGIGRKADSQAGWSTALRSILANGAFLRAILASFFVAIIFWQISSTLGLQIIEHSGLGEQTYGLLLGLNGIMIVFLELPITNWTRTWNPQRAMALGYCLVGIGLALLAFGATLTMLIISMIILTTGEMIALPVSSSYVAKLSPDHMRGRYMGFMGLSWSVAISAGPMIGLRVFEVSPPLLWVLCGVTGFISAWIILRPNNKPPQLP